MAVRQVVRLEAAAADLTADERATIVGYLDRVAETLDAYRASLDAGTR